MASHFLRKVLFLFMGLSLSLSAFAEDFVIKVRQNFSIVDLESQLKDIPNVKILDQHQTGQLILIRIPSDMKEVDLEKTLKTFDAFEYIVPNVKFHINSLSAPNDPQFSKQWALNKVGASNAWGRLKSDVRPIVAVIDTGIDYNHEDLKDQILRDGSGAVKGWNYIENNNDPMDITSSAPRGNPGHGTHCAGIIGASVDNGIGVSGMAPKVWLMPLRFIGPDGSGDLMNSVKAVDFAIENGAQIISASWGAAVPRNVIKPLLEAIERAGQKGVIFVAAAANDGKSNDTREVYPANAGLPNVISVAASDSSDQKPQWSNYGRAKVDLSSPGAAILSTLPNNKYGELSGTSMATPLVAGLVALLLGQSSTNGQRFNAPEFKAILQANSQKVEIETACNCRISADQTMAAILENTLTVVPNSGTLAPGESLAFHAIGGKGPYHFTSSNPAAATITDDGQLKAIADGQSVIKVVDADNKTAQSHEVFVGQKATPPPPGGDCPLGDPQLCEILCRVIPDAPWCKKVDRLLSLEN